MGIRQKLQSILPAMQLRLVIYLAQSVSMFTLGTTQRALALAFQIRPQFQLGAALALLGIQAAALSP
jgi:hypothetical protein